MIDAQIEEIDFDKVDNSFKILGVIEITFGFLTSIGSTLGIALISYGWPAFIKWNEEA